MNFNFIIEGNKSVFKTLKIQLLIKKTANKMLTV